MGNRIYENDSIEIFFDDRGGDMVVVTFNELFYSSNGMDYWGSAPLATLAISALGIVSKRRDWFPERGLVEAAELLHAITTRFKKVVTYGFSQGAYGAIRHSKFLSATHVLAFSPQCSISPSLVGHFETQYREYYCPDIHDGMRPEPFQVSGKLFMFYDPYSKADRSHVEFLSHLPDFCPMPIRNVGHGTVRVVASTSAFNKVLDFAFGKIEPNEMYQFLRRCKKSTAAHLVALSERSLASGGRHDSWALSLCRKADAIASGNASVAVLQKRLEMAISERDSHVALKDSEIVQALYLAILGRKADPGGMATYKPAVRQAKTVKDFANIVSSMLNSREYKERAQRSAITT